MVSLTRLQIALIISVIVLAALFLVWFFLIRKKVGVYLYVYGKVSKYNSATSDYTPAFTYASAQAKATSLNSKLATADQITSAINNLDFGKCEWGWMDGGKIILPSNKTMAGNSTLCTPNTLGINVYPNATPDKQFSAYMYGPIPSDATASAAQTWNWY